MDTRSSSIHYSDIIMGAIATQITSLTIVYSAVYSDADQRKHQSSASLAFVRGIHRWPVNFPQNWPLTRKMFPFDDVIMSKNGMSNYLRVIFVEIIRYTNIGKPNPHVDPQFQMGQRADDIQPKLSLKWRVINVKSCVTHLEMYHSMDLNAFQIRWPSDDTLISISSARMCRFIQSDLGFISKLVFRKMSGRPVVWSL